MGDLARVGREDSVAKTQKVSTNAANRCLCSDSEQLVDELHLRYRVAFCHWSRSPLLDHFRCLDPGRVEDWRHCSVGLAYLLLPVSVGSASLAVP